MLLIIIRVYSYITIFFLMIRRPPRSTRTDTLFPYTTLFRSFDQVFNKVFKGLLADYGQAPVDIPEEWLKAVAEKYLTPEEMEAIKSLGSWDEIMETMKKRLEEQQKRHQGGNKWIGTCGTSPFGHSGYNPEGVRIGGERKHNNQLQVWDTRECKKKTKEQ